MDEAMVHEFMRTLWLVFGVIVGASLGSFANVVVYRVPRGLSVVHPRSRCPACEKPIAGWDNIPVASWLVLRGKARCCGVPISSRYMWVEVLGAVLGFLVVSQDGASLAAAVHGMMLLLLVSAALIDLDSWTIPRPLSLGMVPLGILGNTAVALLDGDTLRNALVHEAGDSAVGAVVGYGVLAGAILVFTWFFRKTGRIGPDEEAMGWGDAHLLAGIGACLGPGAVFWVLTLASFQGALVGIGQAFRHQEEPPPAPAADAAPKGNEDDEDDWMPPQGAMKFGPFLALAAAEVLFLGHLLPDLRLDLMGS